MKKEVDIKISEQAEILLENLDINILDLIKWFTEIKQISIGGGDIISYLKYKRDDNNGN